MEKIKPKQKALNLINGMIEVDKKLNKHPMSKKLAKELSLLCIKEIIDFGSNQGIREPLMYWSMVRTEINKL